jgi:hypothetical protein
MTCQHFDPGAACCEAGVSYQKLAGGGTHYQVLRLPCIPISNRRGETASQCNQFSEQKEQNP